MMSFKPLNVLEVFKCAISKDDHIVKEPLSLTNCNHFICDNCLVKITSETIKCRVCCEITNKRQITNDAKSSALRKTLKLNYENLLMYFQENLNQSKKTLLDLISMGDQKINSKIDFIKHEVELKIESIKIDLDNYGEELFKQVEELKTKILNLNEIDANIELDRTDNLLNELKYDLENNGNHHEENVYKFENGLKSLNALIEKIKDSIIDINFDESKCNITNDIIGEIRYYHKNSLSQQELERLLKDENFDEKQLETSPNDLRLFPNNMLALSNSSQKNITILDENLDLIRTINKIDNELFHPLRIETNNLNIAYITEFSRCQVIMTDLNFNKIKSVGSRGSNNDQFNYPNGVVLFYNKLFVTDTENKRVHVLSQDLDFEKIHSLEYKPWIIKISDEKTISISRFDKPGLYFYDFDSFQYIKHYDDHGFGRLSEISSFFCEFCKQSPKLYFYDKKGNLLNIIEMKIFGDNIASHADGILVYHNKHLIISSESKRRLLKLKKKSLK